MDEERRVATIEMILMELGGIKNSVNELNNRTSELGHKIGVQNGRVGKLELDRAKRDGVLMTIQIFMIPPLLGVVWFIIQFFLNFLVR